MSKYNNMQSIPIKSLSKEELEEAFKEWAEGNEALEQLLRICYSKGVETNGSHIGKTNSYLQLILNDSKEDIIKMLNVAEQIKDTQVLISPDASNPFSGQGWEKPSLCVGLYGDEEKSTKLFEEMDKALLSQEEPRKDGVFAQMLELYEAFASKNSCLMFRAKHTKDDQYKFIVELLFRESAIDYDNQLFEKAGLKLKPKKDERSPLTEWEMESDSLEGLAKKMKKSISTIITEYALRPPTLEDEERLPYGIYAHFMKEKLGPDFETWLEEQEEKLCKPLQETKKKDNDIEL